jgi:hypothetical protein
MVDPFWIAAALLVTGVVGYVAYKWYQRGAEVKDLRAVIDAAAKDASYALVKFNEIMDDWYGEDKDIPDHLTNLGHDIAQVSDRIDDKRWPTPGETIAAVNKAKKFAKRRQGRAK